MTTICTDGETIAADMLITGNGLNHGTFSKLARASDGSVIGGVGSPFDLASFVEWYDGDRSTAWSDTDESEFLVLSPCGIIRCFNHLGRSYIATAPQAIGSGAGVAYGALAMGASPKQAVEAASKYDYRTGGGVESMSASARAVSVDNADKPMSTCNKCGLQFPSAPSGTIHKCQCSGGMMMPNNRAT